MGLFDKKEKEVNPEVEEVVEALDTKDAPTPPDPAQETLTASPVQPERKPETKRSASRPWKPASTITIPEHMKEAGWRYRWVDSSKDGNIQKKLAEGWEMDAKLSKKLDKVSANIHDGSNVDSTTSVRELVVMRMPEDMAKARTEYYKDKIVDGKKMQSNLQGEAGKLAYGKVDEGRGAVDNFNT